MKKVIRLTESDLVRIVKRVIKEQAEMSSPKYRMNAWTPDSWYDEDERQVDDIDDDFEEEVEFGPEDYDNFMDYIKDIKHNWSLGYGAPGKRWYDKHTKTQPVKIRKYK